MSIVEHAVLSNSKNVAFQRKRIQEVLFQISGKKNPYFLLGRSNGRWNFKCYSSLLGLNGPKFFSIKNESIEYIIEVIQRKQEE